MALDKSIETVIVHTTVVLAVADHNLRSTRKGNKRVIGTLLSDEDSPDGLHITNSFAIPFAEDNSNPDVWIVDCNFHTAMASMYIKVNPKEKIIGWYSKGSDITATDVRIHKKLTEHTGKPLILLKVDLNPELEDVPLRAYTAKRSTSAGYLEDLEFTPINLEVGNSEPEEIGIEHLMRGIRATAQTPVCEHISDRIRATKILCKKLKETSDYINEGIETNSEIVTEVVMNTQAALDILNTASLNNFDQAFLTHTFETSLCTAGASVLRTALALNSFFDKEIAHIKSNQKVKEDTEVEGLLSAAKGQLTL